MQTRAHIKACFAACVAALLACLLFVPVPALADDDMEALQAKVEETAKAYGEATAKVEQIQADIEANEAAIAEIEAALPGQREQAATAMRDLYKLHRSTPGLVSLILSSDDFNQFLTMVTYFDAIQSHNVDSVDALVEAEAELDMRRAELDQQKAEAEKEARAAEEALEQAKEARAEAQRRAEEEAARQAAAAAAALEAARAAAAAQETITTASGNTAEVAAPEENGNAADPAQDSQVDWNSDRDAFIAHWAPRIDAFLGGHTLGGHGATFAAAAWDCGVDPRVSPAISFIESTGGDFCFRPHNAWGWGQASWGSWDDAIYGHVSGFASIYGYTLTPSGAEMYCPGTGGYYYSLFTIYVNSI